MKTIPFARVSCDGNELAYIREALESGWLTTASKAQELDRHGGAEAAKALVVLHFGGQAAPMLDENGKGLLSLCRDNGIKIVEDAAHAFPAFYGTGKGEKGKASKREDAKQEAIRLPVGSIGDIACFSFYANKTITTGEGGRN